MKHLLTIADMTVEEFEKILSLTEKLKKQLKTGVANRTLEGKTLGMIFAKSSTRTRVSFEVALFKRNYDKDV